MTYAELIAYIEARVYANTNNEVTAANLQAVCKAIAQYADDNKVDTTDFIRIEAGEIPIENPIVFKTGGNKEYQLINDSGELKIESYDSVGEVFETAQSFQGRFGNQIVMPNVENYASYEYTSIISVTVAAGGERTIDITKIIGNDYFDLNSGEITIQNLPTGYTCYVECVIECNFQKTGGTGVNAGIEIARTRGITTANYYTAITLNSNEQVATKHKCFTILNGDVIKFNFKNFDTTDFDVLIARFETFIKIVAFQPIPS